MKHTILFITMVMVINQLNSQKKDKLDDQYLDLTKINIEKNSDLFKIDTIDNEQVLTLTGNTYNQEIDEFTEKKKDDSRGGKVVLFGDKLKDYSMIVDMKFLGFHVENFPSGGWFGFALRAQDLENYEIVWFMPGGGGESNTVAYVPVAHGVVPWWTEAYDKQEKGNVALPKNNWFTARVDVKRDEFSIYVDDQFVFKKKMTYYLTSGKPGLFVGTASDVAFRRIKIE
jgi:hypothetical protein